MSRTGVWMAIAIFACNTVAFNTGYATAPEAIHGANGMVASRSQIASVVGATILSEGGNAIDAAVAVGFALAVTYPSAGNLAGGGFMLIRLADGTVVANDHRETAPAAASRDMYLDAEGNLIKGRSTETHLAVGVPGTVHGLLTVLERYGTMDRAEVIKPAENLANRGFMLPRDMALDIARRASLFAQHPGSKKQFSAPDGTPFKPGDVFVQKDLGETLKAIRVKGIAGFYEDRIADLLVAEMERGGGLITLKDLADYRSVWRTPLEGTYRGHKIVSMPPPSSGGVLLIQMLNMLEPYDVKSMGYGSADAIHLLIEAERRAYADRAEHLGDSDFYPVPVEQMISKAYAAKRFSDFNALKATRSDAVGAGEVPWESPDTTHASVIDRHGNAVSYTTTLNT
ncbi:MAG: gamma-glutamyltransferase, partial [Proteobacteria bacterium]|nr:gamma-glutamyltransferase [Pseudomonadota bacterium]